MVSTKISLLCGCVKGLRGSAKDFVEVHLEKVNELSRASLKVIWHGAVTNHTSNFEGAFIREWVSPGLFEAMLKLITRQFRYEVVESLRGIDFGVLSDKISESQFFRRMRGV